MEVQLSEERQAQLADYAKRHGQEPAAALDELLADALETDQQAYLQRVEALHRSLESMKAGRTRPASEFLDELRARHGF